MLVSISGISDNKFKKTMLIACEFYLGILLPKQLRKHIILDIELDRKLDDDADGYCEVSGYNRQGKPREFSIQIKKNASRRYMLMTLAHELVHVKQFATGELHESMNVWKGKRMPSKTDYWDTPWEVEAHGREAGLYTRFCEKYHLKFKRTAFERDN